MKLPFGRWQCPKCEIVLSEDIEVCPICKGKAVDKAEIRKIKRNYVKSVYDARVNVSSSRKAYLKRVRDINKLAAEARLKPAKLKPYLVTKEEREENKKKLLKQLKDF